MISTIKIEHGETTCASEPGKFCRFLGTKNFGTQPVCMLNGDLPLFEHSEGEKKGWLARSGACINEFGSHEGQ